MTENGAVLFYFLKRLRHETIWCVPDSTQVCVIRDISLICGRITRQRRPDTGEMELITNLNVAINISPLARIERLADCNQTTCHFLNIPVENCEELCVPAYNRFIKVAMLWVKCPYNALVDRPRMVVPHKWVKISCLATANYPVIVYSFGNANHKISVNLWWTVMLGVYYIKVKTLVGKTLSWWIQTLRNAQQLHACFFCSPSLFGPVPKFLVINWKV